MPGGTHYNVSVVEQNAGSDTSSTQPFVVVNRGEYSYRKAVTDDRASSSSKSTSLSRSRSRRSCTPPDPRPPTSGSSNTRRARAPKNSIDDPFLQLPARSSDHHQRFHYPLDVTTNTSPIPLPPATDSASTTPAIEKAVIRVPLATPSRSSNSSSFGDENSSTTTSPSPAAAHEQEQELAIYPSSLDMMERFANVEEVNRRSLQEQRRSRVDECASRRSRSRSSPCTGEEDETGATLLVIPPLRYADRATYRCPTCNPLYYYQQYMLSTSVFALEPKEVLVTNTILIVMLCLFVYFAAVPLLAWGMFSGRYLSLS